MFKSNLEIINRRWKRHFQGLYEDMISSLRLAGSSPSLGTTLQSHSWSKASVLLGQLLDLPRNRTITLHLFALAWNASLQAKHPDHKHTWIRHALGLALETEDQELVVKTGVRLVELNIETGDLQAADHIAWVLETSNHRQIRMLRLQIQRFKGLIDIMNGRKTYDINPLHLSNLLDKIWKQIKDPRTQAITLQWMIQIQMELATGSSDFDNPQLIQRIANNVNFCLSKLMAQQDLLPWFSKVLWNASLACISHSHLRSQVLEAASKLFEAQRDIVSQTNCQILIVATQIQIIESKEDCVDKLRLFETLEIMKKQLASLAVDPKKQNVVKIYEFKLALLLEDIALASRIIEKTIEEEYEGCQTFALLYCVLRKYPRKCGTSLWLLEIKALQGLIMCVTRVPGHSAREVFHLFSKLLATGLFIEELELLEEARQTIQEYLKLEYMSEQDVRCLVVMVKNLWNGGVKFGENGQTDLGKSGQAQKSKFDSTQLRRDGHFFWCILFGRSTSTTFSPGSRRFNGVSLHPGGILMITSHRSEISTSPLRVIRAVGSDVGNGGRFSLTLC
ncbi:hypothetical protein TCAL_15194 [Tigriopus californicus]|uniref:Uncharacterized protein n=1 Tax=Tigriopus californicus TaxID=6832 RepID=A0A553NEC7_TIGCA|nr:hypothetical protein TCAL_15194 [Tigriopus californicus]